MIDPFVFERLSERCRMLSRKKRDNLQQLDELTNFVELEADAYTLLTHLKETYAGKAVKLYSELLTSLVKEVMGENAQPIILKPYLHKNMSALDVLVDNDGVYEDVIQSRGGSLINILATGFRFISLALTNQRRFIVLDEPDCWLAPHLVPAYYRVVEQLCAKLSVQAVIISHKEDPESDTAQCISLRRVDGKVVANVDQFATAIEEDHEGLVGAEYHKGLQIKKIELNQFTSHESTQLELGPGLTLISGENDLGKSNITRAIRGFATNSRRADLIMNHKSAASVSFTVEDDVKVTWSLERGSNNQVHGNYSASNAHGEILEVKSKATGIPDFISEIMAMGEKQGSVDAHIGQQTDAAFVLSPTISAYQRAKTINLGSDFKVIDTAISLHRDKMRDANRDIKRLRNDIDEINDSLKPYTLLDDIEALKELLVKFEGPLNQLSKDISSIEAFNQQRLAIPEGVDGVELLCELSSVAKQFNSFVDDAKQIGSYAKLNRALETHEELSEFSGVIGDACDLLAEWSNLSGVLEKVLDRKDADALTLANSLQRDIAALQSSSSIYENQLHLLSQYNEAKKGLERTRGEVNSMVEQKQTVIQRAQAIGDHSLRCPTCSQSLLHESEKGGGV